MEHMAKNNQTDQCGCGCECASQNESTIQDSVREKAAPRRTYVPAVDLVENDSTISLVVDVPGVADGGVDLRVEKNILTLSAVPADGVIAGKKLAYSEYGVGEYRRSFVLSDEIDREAISASLKNGVLRISLTKAVPVRKKITVSSN